MNIKSFLNKILSPISILFLFIISLTGCGSTSPIIDTITITSEKDSLFIGETMQFGCTLSPSDADINDVIWSTEDESIISITKSGFATALSEGFAVIEATSKNSDVLDAVGIQIDKYISVESIKMGLTNKEIPLDGFSCLSMSVEPENASNQKFTYTSSNEQVMTVDSDGLVLAKKEGKATITATSVDNTSLTKSIDLETTPSPSWNNYHVDTHINDTYSLQDSKLSQQEDAIPITDDPVETLVIPIEFSDYPFSDEDVNKLDTLFNGDGKKDTGYWESVNSYYTKSSYGKTNMHSTISSIIKPINSETGKQYTTSDLKDKTYNDTWTILRNAVNEYKTTNNTNCKQFDADSNGFIDAVFLIYSAPTFREDEDLNKSIFWNWTYWDQSQSPVIDSPISKNYTWISNSTFTSEHSTYDTHTLIHETGHLFGLSDYYNTKFTNGPLGGADMMDMAIGDNNQVSKLMLNWVDPIVVTGNAKITISSAEDKGQVILLAGDDYNLTPYDEMITLELTTPTGLNELDSKTNYSTLIPKYCEQPGIKAIHSDNRLMDVETREYVDPHDIEGTTNEYCIAASNTPDFPTGFNLTKDNLYQVGLIQATKSGDFLKKWKMASDDDLFHAGSHFTFDEYQNSFQKEGTLNNGNKCQYQFYVESITNEEATIIIERI